MEKKIGVAKRDLKDDAIGEVIDLNLSLEDNLDVIRKNGISLKKKRLVEFCERYNLKLKTNKEIRNDKIIDLYKENKDSSLGNKMLINTSPLALIQSTMMLLRAWSMYQILQTAICCRYLTGQAD